MEGEPDFEWDDDDDDAGNVAHIARHGVTPTEAEDAVLDPAAVPAPASRIPTERRRAIVGATAAGRVLFVICTRREGAIRVISAYPAPERDRRRYRRR